LHIYNLIKNLSEVKQKINKAETIQFTYMQQLRKWT